MTGCKIWVNTKQDLRFGRQNINRMRRLRAELEGVKNARVTEKRAKLSANNAASMDHTVTYGTGRTAGSGKPPEGARSYFV